jgi:hypothetical protein
VRPLAAFTGSCPNSGAALGGMQFTLSFGVAARYGFAPLLVSRPL